MEYVIVVIVVMVGGFVAFGVHHVREETAPGARPSLREARRTLRQSRILASGELCMCGGTLGDVGEISPKFGPLQSCADCNRSWTMDGRSVVRRRRPRAVSRRAPGPRNDLRLSRRFLDGPGPAERQADPSRGEPDRPAELPEPEL